MDARKAVLPDDADHLGRCIVHLSHPEFSGNVLHTSGVVEVTEHKVCHIAETRNNYYVLLGAELVMPVNCKVDPRTYVMEQRDHWRQSDIYASAAINADRDAQDVAERASTSTVSDN